MSRAKEALRSREDLAMAAAVAGLVLFYLITTVPNIGNHPLAGGDEGWIISASAKLAQKGVFGSDLFAGFYDADKRYYFNLPLFHLVLAGVFKVFGVGLSQARFTTAAFGLATLALTYALGLRTGGRWVGLGAAALLVLLRLNLTPLTGLTLTDLGATVRYDLPAVPFALGALLLLLRATRGGKGDGLRPESRSYGEVRAAEAGITGEGPRPEISGFGKGRSNGRESAFWRKAGNTQIALAASSGFVLGLGCLTQFIDALMIAPLALFILTLAMPLRRRAALLAAFFVSVAAPFLPYLAYAASDWHDFRGQSRSFEQRSDVFSPGFYLDNVRHEFDRYDLALDIDARASIAELVERPSARLALLAVGPLALARLFVRSRGSSSRRLVAFVLAGLVLEFAFLESTKRFVYWVIVVPFLCVAIADGAAALLAWRPGRRLAQPAATGAALVIAAVIALEGLAVGAGNVRDARDAVDYSRVGEEVRGAVPPGSRIVTDNRMWLTLRDTDPRSLLLLFYWTNPKIAGGELTDVQGAMDRIDADYVLLSPLTKEILAKLTASDSERFARYMDGHASLVATVSKPPYGPIEVYRLR